MATLGASLAKVEPGAVEITLKPSPAVSQQHGFVHAGAVTSIANSAAGYAALSLMPPGTGVLSAEFKINLTAPAAGDLLRAKGRVIKAGRALHPRPDRGVRRKRYREKLVALLTATMMCIENRDGVAD